MTPTRRGVVALVAAVLLLAACQPGTPEGPQPAPVLSGPDLEAQPRDLADLKGKVVVVNAWASWCEPCRKEMPVLDEAEATLGSEGLAVMGLNVRDRPESAQRLVQETGVDFPSIVDADGKQAVEWGIWGLPQTYLVDRDGNVVAHQIGPVDEEWIQSTVSPLVTEGKLP